MCLEDGTKITYSSSIGGYVLISMDNRDDANNLTTTKCAYDTTTPSFPSSTLDAKIAT